MKKTSPKEQYIIYPIKSVNLTVTNVIFYLKIATTICILLSKGIIASQKVVTNNWFLLSESLYRTLLLKIENFLGSKQQIYLPLLYSLFHIVLFSNFLGLLPYSTTSTAEIILTLSLAFTLLFGILLLGFLQHRLNLLAIFLPSGTPLGLIPVKIVLEILAYIFRIISLGLRLAINKITGHVLVKTIIGGIWIAYLKGISLLFLSLPLLLLTAFLALEILIAYLQAYIIVFITILTIKDVSMS